MNTTVEIITQATNLIVATCIDTAFIPRLTVRILWNLNRDLKRDILKLSVRHQSIHERCVLSDVLSSYTKQRSMSGCQETGMKSRQWGLLRRIHSGYFYSAVSSPLLLRSAPDTARTLCRSFTPERTRNCG